MDILNRMRDRWINGEMDGHAIDDNLSNIYTWLCTKLSKKMLEYDMKATPARDRIDMALGSWKNQKS